MVTLPEPAGPGAGEIRVRLHASSVNFHDYAVARGFLPSADGRILMADGAGVVEAVGTGVTEFAVGDHVVSCFSPLWLDGVAPFADFSKTPGDGFGRRLSPAREVAVTPATWFTKAPKGFTHAQAATLTTAGLTAWRALVVEGGSEGGRHRAWCSGTGGVSIFRRFRSPSSSGAVVIADIFLRQEARARASIPGRRLHTINYKIRARGMGRHSASQLTGGQGVGSCRRDGRSRDPAAVDYCGSKTGGRIGLIGTLTRQNGDLPLSLLMIKNVTSAGHPGRGEPPPAAGPGAGHGGRVDSSLMIDRTFALDQLADAFRYEESGAALGQDLPGLLT